MKMIYCIRDTSRDQTLVEFETEGDMRREIGKYTDPRLIRFWLLGKKAAQEWVDAGKKHETGLEAKR
jgi:hypothetical protein